MLTYVKRNKEIDTIIVYSYDRFSRTGPNGAYISLNKLYKFTQLQSSFSVNNIALVKGRPQLLNLLQLKKTLKMF